jgi:uncharacterized protein YkwD
MKTRRAGAIAAILTASSVFAAVPLFAASSPSTPSTAAPTITPNVTQRHNAVRVAWRFASSMRQRDRVLEIARSTGGTAFTVVFTRRSASRTGVWLDRTAPVDGTRYEARLNGGAWGPVATIELGSTTTAPASVTTIAAGPQGPFPCQGGVAMQVLDIVNAYRVSIGLNALAYSPALATGGYNIVAYNAQRGLRCQSLSHDRDAKYLKDYKLWAEADLGSGQLSPQDAFNTWMNSPGHRQYIEAWGLRFGAGACAYIRVPWDKGYWDIFYWAYVFGE